MLHPFIFFWTAHCIVHIVKEFCIGILKHIKYPHVAFNAALLVSVVSLQLSAAEKIQWTCNKTRGPPGQTGGKIYQLKKHN